MGFSRLLWPCFDKGFNYIKILRQCCINAEIVLKMRQNIWYFTGRNFYVFRVFGWNSRNFIVKGFPEIWNSPVYSRKIFIELYVASPFLVFFFQLAKNSRENIFLENATASVPRRELRRNHGYFDASPRAVKLWVGFLVAVLNRHWSRAHVPSFWC